MKFIWNSIDCKIICLYIWALSAILLGFNLKVRFLVLLFLLDFTCDDTPLIWIVSLHQLLSHVILQISNSAWKQVLQIEFVFNFVVALLSYDIDYTFHVLSRKLSDIHAQLFLFVQRNWIIRVVWSIWSSLLIVLTGT